MSVKTKFIARILDLCQPLQADGTVRKIVRTHALFLTEAQRPALHIVTGDETAIVEDERGYTMKIPVAFELIFSEQKDPYSAADEFESFLQKTIETDEQLGGLVSKLTYEGSSTFISEEQKPSAMVLVMYQVEYRRQRGAPDIAY